MSWLVIPTVTIIPDPDGFVAALQWIDEESGLTGSWSVGPAETVEQLLSAMLDFQKESGRDWYWLHREPHTPRLVIPSLPTPVQTALQTWAREQAWALEIASM